MVLGISCSGGKVIALAHPVVLQVHVLNFHVLLRRSCRIFLNATLIHTLFHVKGDVQASSFGTLGGDEDNAVGSAVTVQGGRGGILQDGHALDVGGVQVGQVAAERNAVNYVQGGGGTVYGADTTDTDGRIRTGGAIVAGDLNTRHSAFQSLSYGRGRTVFQFFGANRGDGAREGGALGGTISDGHYSLVQQFAVGFESDVHDVLHGDFDGHHADAGDFQGLGVIGNARESEITIQIGYNTD